MVDIELPAYADPVPVLESAALHAGALATGLRAVQVGVKDAQAWAEARGVPTGWQGDAREVADHARTRFARRLSVSEAALQRAIVATDRFEERLVGLGLRRSDLLRRRTDLNDAIDALRREIDGNDPVPTSVAAWERRARELRQLADRLRGDVAAWEVDVRDAESDYIRALRRVDEVDEGASAAQAPAQPDPTLLRRALERHAGDPSALAAWWAGLTRAQRQALVTEHPHAVGNTAGVPVGDRDEANRAALLSDIDRLSRQEADGDLTDAECRVLANARVIHAELAMRSETIDPLTGEHLLNVVVYEPVEHDGDGGVAISVGDPDAADHVSVSVPGLTSEVASLGGNLDNVEALHHAASARTDGSVATVFWLDYDAPSGDPLTGLEDLRDLGSVVGPDAADRGGQRLAAFIDGLRASDKGPDAHLTVIGHSYGSTTVGHALQDGAGVHDAILLGSPGQPEHTATALTGGQVWVGSRDDDPVTLVGAEDGPGTLGTDPAQASFGATRFETGDGPSRLQDALTNHTTYFQGESLRNMAAIVTDHDDDVTIDAGRDRWSPDGHYRTLPEWLVESLIRGGASAAWDGLEDLVAR